MYGVVCGSQNPDSKLHSGDLLASIHHPDPDHPTNPGQASADEADIERFAYNLQGELIWKKERGDEDAAFDPGTLPNATQHLFTRNAQGLLTSDKVISFGPGIDSRVDELRTQFDPLGRPVVMTSVGVDAFGLETTVNQVRITRGR